MSERASERVSGGDRQRGAGRAEGKCRRGVERSARQRGETACGIKDEIKKEKKVQEEGGV